MKSNFSFFAVVIALLLISSAVLTGCMYAIAADNGDDKQYDLDVQKNNFSNKENKEDIELGDAPAEQSTMQEKFNEYLHIDGNTVTVFSKEQYLELKSVRDEGKRIPLSYDEILYIVGDSINLYFTYDKITLTKSSEDDILPNRNYQFGNDRVIFPEYRKNNEYFDYFSAYSSYKKMLHDIYEIIYHRIYIHDAGFAKVIHYNQYIENKTELIAPGSASDDYTEANGYIISWTYQMLSIDDSTVGGLQNEEKLVEEYKKIVEQERAFSSNYESPTDIKLPKLNSRILATTIRSELKDENDGMFFILNPYGTSQIIYPTLELKNMMPDRRYTYISESQSDNASQPVFFLNHDDVTVQMGSSMYASFAAFGRFKEYDGVLDMHFAHNDTQYYYVFYRKNNGYVFSAKDSKPLPFNGFSFPDGFTFVKFESHDIEEQKPNNNNPTGIEAEDFERYYPDELFDISVLAKIVDWDYIYETEKRLLETNEYFYSEQLPPIYLFIKEMNIKKEDFIAVNDELSHEQIEIIFSDADIETIMQKLKADWAFYYKGRLYNIFELSKLDKDLIIDLRESGALDNYIQYMDSLDVKFEALDFIKNAGK